MKEAIEFVVKKLDNFGRIKADSLSPGKHFKIYRKAGNLSPFNTVKAQRV